MLVYRMRDGAYAPTQALAGRGAVKVDVPTTEGRQALCDWLNENAVPKGTRIVEPSPCRPEQPEREDWSATASLARMEAVEAGEPGDVVDQTVRRIMMARGYTLKRYAGAVSIAFSNLDGKA